MVFSCLSFKKIIPCCVVVFRRGYMKNIMKIGLDDDAQCINNGKNIRVKNVLKKIFSKFVALNLK